MVRDRFWTRKWSGKCWLVFERFEKPFLEIKFKIYRIFVLEAQNLIILDFQTVLFKNPNFIGLGMDNWHAGRRTGQRKPSPYLPERSVHHQLPSFQFWPQHHQRKLRYLTFLKIGLVNYAINAYLYCADRSRASRSLFTNDVVFFFARFLGHSLRTFWRNAASSRKPSSSISLKQMEMNCYVL